MFSTDCQKGNRKICFWFQNRLRCFKRQSVDRNGHKFVPKKRHLNFGPCRIIGSYTQNILDGE